MSVLISIIMPLYNAENILHYGIDSFLAQSMRENCELICIDDGSTDKTMLYLRDYAANYPNAIRVLCQKHKGSGCARNLGLREAKGQYIGFLDADDSFPSDKTIEHIINAAEDTDAQIIGGSLSSFELSEDGQEVPVAVSKMYIFNHDGHVQYSDYQVDFAYQRFIYSRHLLQSNNIEFPNYSRYQDPPFFVEAMIAASEFYALSEPTYHYRLNDSKVNWNAQKIRDMLEGVVDVGAMAAHNNLDRLFLLNQNRLKDYWEKFLKKRIFENQAIDVLEMVVFAKKRLDDVGQQAGFSAELFSFDKAFEEYFVNILSMTPPVELGYRQVKPHLAEIKKSNSWTIGRTITKLPHFFIKHYKRHG